MKNVFFSLTFLTSQIITLVEELSLALGDDFKQHLPDLMPRMLAILHTDQSDQRRPTRAVLHALEVIGINMEASVHILIPAIVRLCEAPAPLPVRKQAISTLSRLCSRVFIADYVPRVIHPLLRVLDSGEASLRDPALQTLVAVAHQLGSDYVTLFHPMVQKILDKNSIVDPNLNSFVSRFVTDPMAPSLLPSRPTDIIIASSGTGGPLNTETVNDEGGGEKGEAVGMVGDASLFLGESGGGEESAEAAAAMSKLKVNDKKLLRTWGSIQVSVKDDWRRCVCAFILLYFCSFFSLSF